MPSYVVAIPSRCGLVVGLNTLSTDFLKHLSFELMKNNDLRLLSGHRYHVLRPDYFMTMMLFEISGLRLLESLCQLSFFQVSELHGMSAKLTTVVSQRDITC